MRFPQKNTPHIDVQIALQQEYPSCWNIVRGKHPSLYGISLKCYDIQGAVDGNQLPAEYHGLFSRRSFAPHSSDDLAFLQLSEYENCRNVK